MQTATNSAVSNSAPAFPATLEAAEVHFTPAAQAKLAELATQAEDVAGIRVFVSGGGCGGMAYGMTFAEQQTSYDSVFAGPGFKVFIDAVALNYLQGSEVDYRDGVNPSFVFNNVFRSVGGSGTCGTCGSAKGSCGG